MDFFKNLFNVNKREINRLLKLVALINNHIKNLQEEDETTLKEEFKTADLNKRIAISCIMSEKHLKLTPFDVQKIGILALLEGKIAEMKTGEGKSLVAAIAAISSTEKQKFIVTTNDYLAKRDAIEYKPLFDSLDCSSNYLQEDIEQSDRKSIYNSQIIYGTNSTFAFDYLYSNMVYNLEDKLQPFQAFAIVDECDSVLIDEAKTPLIISDQNQVSNDFYLETFNICKELVEETHFEVNLKNKSVLLNEEGFLAIEKGLNKTQKELFTSENSHLVNQCNQSLVAINIYEIDIDYVVDNNEVKIIDEYSGRIQDGRRFGNGLHQALEIKENLEPKSESSTIAETSYQSYFGLFDKISGMSGTAQSEATEFAEIYGLDTITIPTNKPVIRKDLEDLIFPDEKAKLKYLIDFVIKEQKENKTPFLIGTISVEQSQLITEAFQEAGIYRATTLNAKNHFKESEIISNAGQPNSITISTNMAGRGVDIKINPEVKEHGLFVIGFERYQNRRIDDQLIGRSGRQGNPGSSLYLLSIDDSILRISDEEKDSKTLNFLKKSLHGEDEGMTFSLFSKTIHKRQKTLQDMFFQQRKEIWEFDKISESHRNYFYKTRDSILKLEDEEFRKKNLDYVKLSVETFFYDIGFQKDLDFSTEELLKIEKEIKSYLFSFISNKDDFELLSTELSKIFKEESSPFDKTYDFCLNNLGFWFKDSKTFEETSTIFNLKYILLHELDNQWHNFLKDVDNLKEGIHLRTYVQKDPKAEYTREGTILFDQMFKTVKLNYLHLLINLISEEEEEHEVSLESIELTEEKLVSILKEELTNNLKIEHISKIFFSANEWLLGLTVTDEDTFKNNLKVFQSLSEEEQSTIFEYCKNDKHNEAYNLLSNRIIKKLKEKLTENNIELDRLAEIINNIYINSGDLTIENLKKHLDDINYEQVLKIFNFNSSALFLNHIDKITFNSTSKEAEEKKITVINDVVSSIKRQVTSDLQQPEAFSYLISLLASNIYLSFQKDKEKILNAVSTHLGINEIKDIYSLRKDLSNIFKTNFITNYSELNSNINSNDLDSLLDEFAISNYSIFLLKNMEAHLDNFLKNDEKKSSKQIISVVIDSSLENSLHVLLSIKGEELREAISSIPSVRKDIYSFLEK